MSKNSKQHTPRKPRPSEIAAKKAKAEAAKKRGPGKPPEEGTAFDKTTMVRMFKADYQTFQAAARKLANGTGAAPSVGAFLRLAGRKLAESLA